MKLILKGNLATNADVHRFRQEAEAAANLDHPNIVPIYEVGDHEGQSYFSMKLVEGGSLAGISTGDVWNGVAGQRLAAELVVKVAEAIHYAHQRGILHRDLKPANILLDRNGQALITDFGLAKRLVDDGRQTRSGAIVGTPAYMPPEQARGERVLTTASDTYSLGAILYELLTGKPPLRGTTPLDTLRQVVEPEPEHPCKVRPDGDHDLATIALKCLEKDLLRRYGSAQALADDLNRWLRGEPILARRISPWRRTLKWVRRRPAAAALIGLSLFAALALATMAGWFTSQLKEERDEIKKQRDQIADHAKDLERFTTRLSMERGVALCQQGEFSHGCQWLTRALQSPGADDPDKRQSLQALLGAWGAPLLRSDAKAYLVATKDGILQQWSLSGLPFGAPMLSLTLRTFGYSPDGKIIAIGGEDGSIRLFDSATNQPLGPTLWDFREVMGIAFSGNGCSLWTVGNDAAARGWAVPTPVPDDPERLRLWLEVFSGRELLQSGVAADLNETEWAIRRERLAKLEGMNRP